MKWKNLQMPKSIELDEQSATERYGKFTIEPLERGFGVTVGNALRRVLLSSLQGAAVTAVRVEGVLHEFSTIPGVLEDVSEIILNLKQMRFKLHADYKINARFKKTGPGAITAGDLVADPGVEVLNPDLVIATLNKEGEVDMEVEVSAGRGYVPADQQDDERPIGVIPVDAHFSPIKKVNFEVENTRVGQRVDFDKLMVEVWTDGSILPKDAVAYAAMILKDHFGLFVEFEEPIEREVEETEDKEVARIRDLLEKSVEELELSVRSANCLRAAEIRTISELVQKPESAMLKYRNFGRKSLKEISDILTEMGLSFGMDVALYVKKAGRKGDLSSPLMGREVMADEGLGGLDDDEEDDDDLKLPADDLEAEDDVEDEDEDEDEDDDDDDGGLSGDEDEDVEGEDQGSKATTATTTTEE